MHPQHLTFYIKIFVDRIAYRLKVEQIYIDKVKEQYRVSGRTKSIVVESNRPFFRNRGIKHRKPKWKVIEGRIENNNNPDPIYQEILKHIEG